MLDYLYLISITLELYVLNSNYVENIKILNECSEMKHRYKPLDLNNADD